MDKLTDVERECAICRYWENTGTKDSGIQSVTGTGNWYYQIGKCNNPKPVLGTFAGQDNIPEFSDFWCYKRHKTKKK